MGIFDRFFKKGAAESSAPREQNDHAVIVHLDGTSLPDQVYEENDLATLEELLVAAISNSGTGEYDGDEMGPTETMVFMYGPDADALFSSVEPVLRAYPLCRNARVEIRRGGPGASQREVRLPSA